MIKEDVAGLGQRADDVDFTVTLVVPAVVDSVTDTQEAGTIEFRFSLITPSSRPAIAVTT